MSRLTPEEAAALAEAQNDDGIITNGTAPDDVPPAEAKPKRKRRSRDELIADGDWDFDNNRAKSSTPRDKKAGPGRTEEALSKKLETDILNAAMFVGLIDVFDGTVIAHNAKSLADAWAKLAMAEPRVKRALEGGLTGSAWLGVIVATSAVVFPIMAHHKLLPAWITAKLDSGMMAAAEPTPA